MEKKNVHKLCINCSHWRYNLNLQKDCCHFSVSAKNTITGEQYSELHDEVRNEWPNMSKSYVMSKQHNFLNADNDCKFYEEGVVYRIVKFFFGAVIW